MKAASKKFGLISYSLLIASLLWVLFTAYSNKQANQLIFSAPQTGFLAPDFVLNDLNGMEYQLSALQGKVIMLNVWASWCKPCQYEMPAMQNVYDKYSSDGFLILAVNNTLQDDYSKINLFVKENNLTFPILLDVKGQVSDLYQVQALPSTYFIDEKGEIVEIVIGGPMSEALIESKIQELIK